MLKLKHTPWLVQRAKFVLKMSLALQEHYKTKKGIDSIIDLDYMGSAEFEFGSLPKSLKRIRENKDQYVLVDHTYKDKPITLYVRKDENGGIDLEEIDKFLLNVETQQHKEWAGLDIYITPNPRLSTFVVDFWWDIDNDIMFWKTDKEFANQFLSVI